MKEGELKLLFPIQMPSDKEAKFVRSGEQIEIEAPKDSNVVSPVDGSLSIEKGREDLGENPNVTTGVRISFSTPDGGNADLSIRSAHGIEITNELQSRISAPKEKSDTGVKVKAGEPLFRITKDSHIAIFVKKPQQS